MLPSERMGLRPPEATRDDLIARAVLLADARTDGGRAIRDALRRYESARTDWDADGLVRAIAEMRGLVRAATDAGATG